MSTQQQPNINVHVQSGTGEVLRIVSTVLLFGGAGALAWVVAQGPNAEMAASGMTMMIVMMAKLMYARGMVAIPSGSGSDFTATKSAIAQIAGEYRQWLSGTSMPALALISAGYAVAFLLLRAAVSAGMGVFGNLYVAGAVMAMVGAVVVFPSLVPSIIASLRRKGVVTDAPAAAPVVQQAPVQQTTPAPAAPEPQQPVVTRRVVRKVVKKEQTND